MLISVDYKTYASITLSINMLSSSYTPGTSAPFVDTLGTYLYVGSTSQLVDYFQGFIYSLAIYPSSPPLDLLETNVCDDCSICPISGICIPACNITNYYSEVVVDCLLCNISCVNGCRNSENCNLCYDYNCVECSSYDVYYCNKCAQNYEVQNGTCIECNYLQFYNSSTNSCDDCSGLCLTCLTDTYCTSCVANSQMDSNHTCKCDSNYSGTESCIENMFAAFISINSNNQPTLLFSEPLLNNLTTNDLVITIAEIVQSFTIIFIDQSTFMININFTSDINSGDILDIQFITKLVSSENSILETHHLGISLFTGSYSDVVSTISKLKSYSQVGITVGLSAALGTSLLNFDPTSFFTFLNSAEIYTYILLYQVELDPVLIAFLNELQFTSKIPNVYSYLIDPNDGVQMTGQVSNFGDTTNLLFLNSGVNMSVLAFFITIILLICWLKRISANNLIKSKLETIQGYFRYGAFSRLWIQSCLEILMSSTLGILTTQLANRTQIIDMVFCCVMLVRAI